MLTQTAPGLLFRYGVLTMELAVKGVMSTLGPQERLGSLDW